MAKQVKRRLIEHASSTRKKQKDLMADLIGLHEEKPEFSELYLHRMAVTNFGAGHDTLCSALTAALAMLGTHHDAQDRAATEILATKKALSTEDALGLPYTTAAIKEAQRLHPAIAMSLPRSVPAKGLHLHGHYIPAGTVVGCNPLALHRNPDVFGDDAADFVPERWLDGQDVKGMERFNLIWGGGGRSCPGRYLAEMIIHKVVPRLLREFEVHVEMPGDEHVRYYFLAIIEGARARFTAREAKDA